MTHADPRSWPHKHVRDRFWERYRLRLPLEAFMALVDGLARGHVPSENVGEDPDAPRKLLIINYRRCPVLIVWDTENGTIVTALPLHRAPRRAGGHT